jgi:hypothetical protein
MQQQQQQQKFLRTSKEKKVEVLLRKNYGKFFE